MGEALLQVRELKTHFFTDLGVIKAVDGVDFSIERGDTLGIVGESGSGKSITALSILRLVPSPPGKIIGGEIVFKGENLLHKPEEEMRKIRGNEISMIFQDPMTSLNPVFQVGAQIAEVIMLHQKKRKREAWDLASEMLHKVGIADPVQRAKEYPHQFSGGMRQRAMIAMALSCSPKLLIADEPTTALDVTIQAQILELMVQLKENYGTAIMLITHDLGVVAELCKKVLVMYAGKPVEYAETDSIFNRPKHPYTLGLLASLPKLDQVGKHRLEPIEGSPPDLNNLPKGCSFVSRCSHKKPECFKFSPFGRYLEPEHYVACHLYN